MQQTGAQGLDKATKLRICRNLATRLGIEHVSAPSINESSPGPLKPILNLYKDIEGLKKHRYKDYDAQLNAKDKGHRCGRHKTKEAARDIYRDAQTCNYRNEATWRDKVESKVMSRLSSEIQCAACRGRIWRAEIEAKSYSEMDSLVARQAQRKYCQCDPLDRGLPLNGRYGLGNIFTWRNEEPFSNPEALRDQLSFSRAPDRVLGLRQTDDISRLLNAKRPDGHVVQDLIPPQPVANINGDPLLFPFMILEAKRDKGDSWEDIYIQTVLPMFTMLERQRHLLVASGNSWTSGPLVWPLVWFFLTRGAEWRLYLAFQMSNGCKGFITRSFQAWNGSVLNADDALHLLLIVDSMLEWARDVYRQEILQSLYELAQANKMALSPSIHSNIYSLSGTPEIKKAGISNPSLEHDSPTILITEDNCVFRNMSWMDQIISASQTSQIPSGGSHQLLSVGSGFPTQSQFNSGGQPLQIISRSVRFLVTEENIGYYFRTLDETLQASNFPAEVLDRHRKQVLGNIIEGLLHLGVPAITVSGQELYDIENAWTGQPNADVLGNSNDLFFFSCRVAYTMEESSKLLRDLYMIAVKPDAFKLLQIALLRLGRVSTELHTLTRNIVGEYTAIPPGSCTFAVQTLRDFSSQENITLASVSTSFSLTYTMGSEGQQIAFPIWTIEGPKQEWFLEWFKNLRGLNFHHPSFLSVSEQVDLLPLTV